MEIEVGDSEGGGIAGLRAKLEALASGADLQAINSLAGEACVALVRDGFATGTAPDGSAWEATQRGNSPLRGPTGALADSASYEASSGGFVLMITDDKAQYHQEKRPMLPSGSMPPKYLAAIERVYRDYLEQHFAK